MWFRVLHPVGGDREPGCQVRRGQLVSRVVSSDGVAPIGARWSAVAPRVPAQERLVVETRAGVVRVGDCVTILREGAAAWTAVEVDRAVDRKQNRVDRVTLERMVAA